MYVCEGPRYLNRYSDELRVGWPRFDARKGKTFLFSPQRPHWFWSPPSLLSNGYRGLFPLEIKWPRREADRSFPTSAEVINAGAIPPLPLGFHGVVRN
jgi:hypothetical protein